MVLSFLQRLSRVHIYVPHIKGGIYTAALESRLDSSSEEEEGFVSKMVDFRAHA